jgi:hypothetical protein
MKQLPTIFFVTDIETTLKKRVAFDVAWQAVDKRGNVYSNGSYVIREAFALDVPYFKEKLGHYFDDTYRHLITPASVFEVRAEYNRQIREFQQKGHRVIACAYNAAFDFKYLPETAAKLTNNEIVRWMEAPVELLDIWGYWGDSVPLHYTAVPSASGKYYSTSAESAYRFEFNNPDFVERHIAWHDVEIETGILLKTIARKKAIPAVDHPSKLVGNVWKRINNRLGITGETSLIPVAA